MSEWDRKVTGMHEEPMNKIGEIMKVRERINRIKIGKIKVN